MTHTSLNIELLSSLQALLPSASLEVFQVPETPIDLFLINADYPRGRLPDDVALAIMENPLYWAFCWASGAVLSQYILRNPQLVDDKTVVDFGCGSGVVAVAAAMAGAKRVIACDIDPLAIMATKSNAMLNNVVLEIEDDFEKVPDSVDLIVAADVLYDRENLPWLKRFQQRAASVLVGDSRIKNFSYDGYRKLGEKESCTLPDLDESAEFRRVSLYQSG